MGDSYRPHQRSEDTRYRGRDYENTSTYYDSDNSRRYNRSRSRSPPRRLDYDDGYDDRDSKRDYGRRDERWQQTRRPPPGPRGHYGRERDRYYDMSYDDYAPVVRPAYYGEKDAATNEVPVKLVLVRELKESTTEELFAKGLEKLYQDSEFADDGGATPLSLRRVLLMHDKETGQSMGFGFAEYHSIDDATAAVAKARKLEARDKLTISSKKFTVAFPHLGVFPHSDYSTAEYNEKYLVQISGSGKKHKYHDDRYYPSELMVNQKSPHKTSSPAKQGSDTEKKTKKTVKETLENKSKKRKAPGAVPQQLSYWGQKQAELRGDEGNAATEESKQPATGVNAIAPTATSTTTTKEPREARAQTWCHEGEVKACYLCNTSFKSTEGILRHIRESELHANNLKDQAAKDRANQRLSTKSIDPGETIPLSDAVGPEQAAATAIAKPQYRDRAAERRQEEVQTGVSSGPPQQKLGFSLKAKIKPGSKGPSPPSSDNEAATKKPSYGKGLDMLQKAGWSEGQGLGSGEGMTAPIEQAMYAAGVGLGHEGSKQGDAMEAADRMTRTDGFLEATKEQARKRFEGMR